MAASADHRRAICSLLGLAVQLQHRLGSSRCYSSFVGLGHAKPHAMSLVDLGGLFLEPGGGREGGRKPGRSLTGVDFRLRALGAVACASSPPPKALN